MLNPIERPIAAVLALFYSWIPNYGVAIILLSLVWMILMAPLTVKQTRSMLAMQKLQPELKRLQDKHKNDRMALTEATQALYKEHGVSPLGGCLPMLLPFPLLIALFQVVDGLSKLTNGRPTPKFLAHTTRMYHDIVQAHGALNAFGMDLAKTAVSGHATFLAALPYFILILVMMGSQYYQQVQMMSRNPMAAQNPQMKMMKYLPILFGIIYIRFPAGVVLYYTISNVCRIGQLWVMYRYDPKVKQLVSQEVTEVEARTYEVEREEKAGPASRPKLRELLSTAAQQANQQAEANRQAKAARRTASSGNGASSGGGTRSAQGKTRGSPAASGGNRRSPAGKGAGGAAKSGTGASGSAKPGAAKRPATAKSSQRAQTGTSRNGSGAKPGAPQKAGVGAPRQPKANRTADTTTTGDSSSSASAKESNGSTSSLPAASRPQSGSRTGASRTGAGTGSRNSRKRRGR